ncbi:patatin-like phospholipase family protein [Candidatus Uhrbacteria bacterium]|nr:patatin-like phospholipase family protein [Candidatus Uhrbacteria bacterium]
MRALVLPGGGLGCVIQGGAGYAFEEMGIRFDRMYACSAGLFTAIPLSTGQIRPASRVWLKDVHGDQFLYWTSASWLGWRADRIRLPRMRFTYLVRRRLLHPGHGNFNLRQLGKYGEVVCFLTDYRTGLARRLAVTSEAHPVKIMYASIVLPGLAGDPVEIGGIPYGDGGVSTPLPLQAALDDGCADITVVLTKPLSHRENPWLFRNILGRLLLRDWPEAQKALRDYANKHNAAVDLLQRLLRFPPPEVTLRVVAQPERGPYAKLFTTDPELLRASFVHGYREAYHVFGKTAPRVLPF